MAEDNPVNLLLAQTLVRDVLPEAKDILVASNGYEASDIYKSHSIDILMDVQMPELNGYKLFSHRFRIRFRK
ncbi:MAG: response regulator [Flavobacteriales bacterium]